LSTYDICPECGYTALIASTLSGNTILAECENEHEWTFTHNETGAE